MVNGVLPAKEPVVAIARLPVSQKVTASAGHHRSSSSNIVASGQPAPLNFSLTHAGTAAEVAKKPEEAHNKNNNSNSRAGSGGLYRPYSTSPTPSRTLPGMYTHSINNVHQFLPVGLGKKLFFLCFTWPNIIIHERTFENYLPTY